MDPFTATLLAISALALLGLPIGLSMICGSIIWLYMRGQDMGLVASRTDAGGRRIGHPPGGPGQKRAEVYVGSGFCATGVHPPPWVA
jgi:hypothetical protein